MPIREGWNAHNDIALKIEALGRGEFPFVNECQAFETIFRADSVENGTFAECMVCLLRHRYEYKHNPDVDNFIAKVGEIFGKSVHEVPREKAQSLFDEFERLLG